MSVIWNKIWFDIWQNKGRSLLVILSIAAGVFAIGAIFGMVDQLLSGMDRAHQAVFPSHINLILRNYVDQSIIDDLSSVEGIAGIEPVNQLTIRYKTDPEEKWKLGTLMQRQDYLNQKYDLIELKEGLWPEGKRLAVERLSSLYFDIPIGDQVIFQVNGEEQTLSIDGKLRHPFVQPPEFGGQAHFFIDSSGLTTFGIPDGYFGQLYVQIDEPYSLEKAQDIAGDLRANLAEKGIGVVVTLYQDPEKHWGRMFVEGVTLVLQIMAIVSLLLSVVLVLNTMMALITQQTDQIGVIKAIGGQAGTIGKIYLVEVLLFGLIGLLIALPISIVFAFYMSQNFLNLFNIDYNEFVVSNRAIVLMILAALIAPILAALWPIIKGASITVREAIATYGLGADFGSSWFDRSVERFSAWFLPTIYAAALGNLFRRKGRLVFTLLVLTIAGVMFLVVMSLVSSIDFTLDNEMARQNFDLRIGMAQNQSIPETLKIIEDVPGIETAEMWLSRNVTILRDAERLQDSAGLGAQLIGVPADTTMYRPLITSGRWLKPDEKDGVVINEETANNNNIQIGDTVILDLGDLGSASWEVVGTYRTVYSSGFVVEPIYAPLDRVGEVTGLTGQGTQIIIRGKQITDLDSETKFGEEIKTALEANGIDLDFYTTTAKLDARQYADNQFNTVVTMLINLAIIMAMTGGIGLMGSLGISVVERKREIGVMRSIGARSVEIGGLFVLEGVLQGLLSFLISVPIAYFLSQPMARLLGQTMIEVDLDFAFNYPAVLIWFGIVITISAVFSLLPARNATRVSVREALSYA